MEQSEILYSISIKEKDGKPILFHKKYPRFLAAIRNKKVEYIEFLECVKEEARKEKLKRAAEKFIHAYLK